jgi:hypothetical protein
MFIKTPLLKILFYMRGRYIIPAQLAEDAA